MPRQNYYSVPLVHLRNEWIEAIEKQQPFDFSSLQFDVCELHFKKGDIVLQGKRIKLREGAVPSVFNW